MIYSIMKSGSSLMWSLSLFMMIIYVFCIFLGNVVAMYVNDNPDSDDMTNYLQYWGSLPRGLMTLYSCMTGGVSWQEVGDPIVRIWWGYGLVLPFFMFFTI